MTKYIRVLENMCSSDNVILKFNKCNDCPLVRFNSKLLEVNCRKFSDGNGENIINGLITGFYKNELIEDVDIPKWCKLHDTIGDIDSCDETYLITEFSVMKSTNPILKKSPVVDKTLTNRKITTNHKNHHYYDGSFDFYNEDNTFDDFFQMNDDFDYVVSNGCNHQKQERCSSCGEENDDVNRHINYGMCQSCYDMKKDDTDYMKQMYIKNFRIKRGVHKNDVLFKTF